MKKKLYILLVLCLASAILAGCIAAEATKPNGGELSGESVVEGLKETVSDEVSEDDAGSGEMTESVASKGEPSDEPNEDEPSEDEPSDDPIGDEPSEDELVANTAYDWDFQKGWPVFVFREEDQDKYMDYPDMCFPYGNPRWVCLAGAFDTLGVELLFHVNLPLCIEKETEPFLQSLGVPYELHYDQIVGQQLIHLNLSYTDSIELLDLMYEAGVARSNMDAVFDFCYCGDTCGASNTVSPELPVWYDILD